MKKATLIIAIIGLSVTASAQPGRKYVRDAYQEKYEKEHADDKQKGMDWVQNAMNGKTDAVYTFTAMVNMHTTTYRDGKKKNENDMQYYLSQGQPYFGMKSENQRRSKDETFIIYDNKNNSMVMLNEKEKTGIAMNINSFMSASAQAKRDKPSDGKTNMKCNKTGKTKNILGHSCYEFVCIDEDRNTRTECWIAPDLKMDISQSFARGPFASLGRTNGPGGFMMEATIYKNEAMESKLEVTDINMKADVSKTIADYKMGAGMK